MWSKGSPLWNVCQPSYNPNNLSKTPPRVFPKPPGGFRQTRGGFGKTIWPLNAGKTTKVGFWQSKSLSKTPPRVFPKPPGGFRQTREFWQNFLPIYSGNIGQNSFWRCERGFGKTRGGFWKDYLAFKHQPRLISSDYPQCFDCLIFCLYGVDVAGFSPHPYNNIPLFL